MLSGPRSDRPAKDQRTSGIRDCSSVAPSAVVPTGCRRTPAAARRSAIAPAGSRDVLRLHRASQSCDSFPPGLPAQARESSSTDGSPAPAPRPICRKKAHPDPKMRPASNPPPIRVKSESSRARQREGFFSELLKDLESLVAEICTLGLFTVALAPFLHQRCRKHWPNKIRPPASGQISVAYPIGAAVGTHATENEKRYG